MCGAQWRTCPTSKSTATTGQSTAPVLVRGAHGLRAGAAWAAAIRAKTAGIPGRKARPTRTFWRKKGARARGWDWSGSSWNQNGAGRRLGLFARAWRQAGGWETGGYLRVWRLPASFHPSSTSSSPPLQLPPPSLLANALASLRVYPTSPHPAPPPLVSSCRIPWSRRRLALPSRLRPTHPSLKRRRESTRILVMMRRTSRPVRAFSRLAGLA